MWFILHSYINPQDQSATKGVIKTALIYLALAPTHQPCKKYLWLDSPLPPPLSSKSDDCVDSNDQTGLLKI